MAWSVDTVFVWVRDLDASVHWYRSLGLEDGPRYGTWQTMSVSGTARFALHEGDRPDGAPTAVIAFRVSDLEVEIERLAKDGIIPIDEVTDTGSGRFVTFEDPDSNQVQLMQREE